MGDAGQMSMDRYGGMLRFPEGEPGHMVETVSMYQTSIGSGENRSKIKGGVTHGPIHGFTLRFSPLRRHTLLYVTNETQAHTYRHQRNK